MQELRVAEVLCVSDNAGYPIALRRLNGGKVTSVQIAMNNQVFFSGLTLVAALAMALVMAAPVLAQEAHQHADAEKLGTVKFANSCSADINPSASMLIGDRPRASRSLVDRIISRRKRR